MIRKIIDFIQYKIMIFEYKIGIDRTEKIDDLVEELYDYEEYCPTEYELEQEYYERAKMLFDDETWEEIERQEQERYWN